MLCHDSISRQRRMKCDENVETKCIQRTGERKKRSMRENWCRRCQSKRFDYPIYHVACYSVTMAYFCFPLHFPSFYLSIIFKLYLFEWCAYVQVYVSAFLSVFVLSLDSSFIDWNKVNVFFFCFRLSMLHLAFLKFRRMFWTEGTSSTRSNSMIGCKFLVTDEKQ